MRSETESEKSQSVASKKSSFAAVNGTNNSNGFSEVIGKNRIHNDLEEEDRLYIQSIESRL